MLRTIRRVTEAIGEVCGSVDVQSISNFSPRTPPGLAFVEESATVRRVKARLPFAGLSSSPTRTSTIRIA